MTLYQVLSLCGVQTLLGAILVGMVAKVSKKITHQRESAVLRQKEQSDQLETVKKEIDTLKIATQAQLRDRLLQGYKEFMSQGYAEYDDKQNWINQYNSYHSLGRNGIMDSYKEKLLNLPDTPPTKATFM